MKVLHVAWGGESLTILLMWRADEPLRLSQMGPELGRRGSYSATFGPQQTWVRTRPKRGGRRGTDAVQALFSRGGANRELLGGALI